MNGKRHVKLALALITLLLVSLRISAQDFNGNARGGQRGSGHLAVPHAGPDIELGTPEPLIEELVLHANQRQEGWI